MVIYSGDFPINSMVDLSMAKCKRSPEGIHQIYPPNFQDFPSNPPSNPPNLSTSHVHSRLKEDIWDVLPEIQDVATAKVAVKQALAPLQEAGLVNTAGFSVGKSSSINGISWDIIHGIYNDIYIYR